MVLWAKNGERKPFMKKKAFLICLIFTLGLICPCLADPLFFPGQEEALRAWGRATKGLAAGCAFHEKSGYGIVAVEEGPMYQLTILQKINEQEWRLAAVNDTLSLEQGRINGLGVDTYEIVDETDGRYAFRVEWSEPPRAYRAFTVWPGENGWRIQHIEGAFVTEEGNMQQWVLIPQEEERGETLWWMEYRFRDREGNCLYQEKFPLPSLRGSADFEQCNPLELFEMARGQAEKQAPGKETN